MRRALVRQGTIRGAGSDIQPDRHRPVVDQFNGHVGAKTAALNRDAERCKIV